MPVVPSVSGTLLHEHDMEGGAGVARAQGGVKAELQCEQALKLVKPVAAACILGGELKCVC